MSSSDNDCQLRIRKIENGYLVISGPQYFCEDLEEVEHRVLKVLGEWGEGHPAPHNRRAPRHNKAREAIRKLKERSEGEK